MRVTLLAVGRLKRGGGEAELATRYRDRFNASGRQLGFGPLVEIELTESRAGKADARRDEEAARLLERCDGDARRIVLDEGGRQLTSQQFADLLGRLRDDGCGEVAFFIGGADGHGGALFDQAHERLSLGPMTLPHGLARVIILEQLYRAVTILSGHPYHRA
jgi:23S rRNA (pseudouridine1915-N3)-methyltransferase